MKPEDINYEPLKSLKHATLYYMNHTWSGSLWVLGVLAVAAGVWFTILAFDPRGLILPIFLFFTFVGHFVRGFKNRIWNNFADANNWGIDTETPFSTLIPPSLQFGHSQHTSSAIQARLGEFSCDMLCYDTTSGSGRSSSTDYFTVAIVKLEKTLPHIVLHAKYGDADLQNDLADAQDLKLEGNFGDYFTLRIEKGQQVDALTVLTPDVMQTLVDYSQNEDIEIIGDSLYFIVKGDKRDPKSVEQLIKSVIELSGQLLENARLTGGISLATSTQSVIPSGSFTLTPSPWSPSVLIKKPNPSRSDIIAFVVIATVLAVLFTWMFIEAKNFPQY